MICMSCSLCGVRRVALGVLGLCVAFGSAQAQTGALKPPVAPVRTVTETYFGQKVNDPYRWLENQRSDESKAWMRAQADYTRATLDGLPGRAAFAADMTKYMNAATVTISDVQLAQKLIFYRKRLRGEDQASLYVRALAGGPERLLVSPAALSTPGHHVSMDQYSPSDDGKYVVVGLSAGGSEEQTGHVYEASTGKELPERLERYEGGGFPVGDQYLYYGQLEKLGPNDPPVNKYKRMMEYRHTMGTPVASDVVILGQGVSPDVTVPDYDFTNATPSAESPYALAVIAGGVATFQTYYIGDESALLSHKGWQKFAGVQDKVSDASLKGNDLYVVSFDGTLNGKLLRLDAAHPDLKTAEVVVPSSDLVFSGGFIGSDVLHQAKDGLYLRVLDKGYGKVLRVPYAKAEKAGLIDMPASFTTAAVVTDRTQDGALIDLMSWTEFGDFYRYDSTKGSLAAMGLEPKNTVDPTDMTSEEVEVTAPDGTKVPLSIIHKKGLKLDGSAPTALIGYGAYGDAFTPAFSRRNIAWIERGGVLAVSHVRGGGELGEGWHLAGKMATKPNTWGDFIASAQYLIDHKYTSSAKLGIWSQSAGGILIGRTITTRPDLFAAAVDGVPCSDMVRIETGPNGPTNTDEFGTVKKEDGFKGLYAMSAYHHVVPGTKYPAVLVTAGANDPRVEPWQGAKMAAALEAANAGPKPILLRVNYDAGHGITDTLQQQVSDWTDIFTFFLWNMGDPAFQPAK